MKLIFTVLTILIIRYSVSAQSGWQIGFEVAPGYYSMRIDMDKNADPEIISVDSSEIFSASRTWAIGANAFYGFTNSIGLQTGLHYSWGDKTTPMAKWGWLVQSSIICNYTYCFLGMVRIKADCDFTLL